MNLPCDPPLNSPTRLSSDTIPPTTNPRMRYSTPTTLAHESGPTRLMTIAIRSSRSQDRPHQGLLSGTFYPAGHAAGRESSSPTDVRSEEHTSELQSQSNLVCRLLLE